MKKWPLLAASFLFLPSVTLAQNSAAITSWGGAKWVWDEPDANKVEQSNDPRYLRRSFTLTARPTKAELWITADNYYIAYVNGEKVGADGEWSTVEKIDVVKHLFVGKNVLAIVARNRGGVAGAIARLYITTADKIGHFIVTNEDTKITQKAPKDWLAANFNDSEWSAAIALGDVGIAPWNLAGSATAFAAPGVPGKGKNYGSNAVDAKIKTRLSAQEQIKHFIVPKDFEIELVAADPIVINPITMILDDKGRIIVSESHTYRYGPPGSPIKPFANPVVRLDPAPGQAQGYVRTLVADGFADPVMGMAQKDGKLWLTACDYLYQYDLLETAPKQPKKGEGVAVNRRTLLTDKNKAWNPFGMFVLEWGPDGKLYMSVGNHPIDIRGPQGSIASRGGSGMIMRMNPDGTQMERLVHGLRVPYSFEYDPFGQLWLLSNGEGNPDRFVRVIEGVDYHCYSRPAIDNNWLAGNHPLAPPCEEVHGGAHTQLMRYYAAAYPQEYQGSLFACNWGRHGFAGANRGIFRYVLDDRNNVVTKDTLVTCTDPHFRPSHIHLDVDGSLLIADWYGRDDESDMTGRIWRLKYVGKDTPVVKHMLDSEKWKNDDYAIEALGSPNHLIREKAMKMLIGRKSDTLSKKLGDNAAAAKEPLGAANAIWAMRQMEVDGAVSGIKHVDWKVRKLALRQDGWSLMMWVISSDKEPAVQLEAAIHNNRPRPSSIVVPKWFTDVLKNGGANDPHIRYEAAWHLAKYGDEKEITALLTSDDANVRLAGLITIDIACYETFQLRDGTKQWPGSEAHKHAARSALAKALENPGKLDHQLLLTVAQLDGDASIVPALEKLLAHDDLPASTVAKAILVLKSKSGGLSKNLGAAAGKRLVEAVEKGTLKIATPADQLTLFEFLESEGPTPFALRQIGGQLHSKQIPLREAAHTLARRFGPKSAALADPLWSSLFQPKVKFDDSLETLSTLARIEAKPRKASWEKLLSHDDRLIRAEAVRWWRAFKDQPDMVETLVRHAPDLVKRDERVKEDLAAVFRGLGVAASATESLNLPAAEADKDAFTKYALQELSAMPEKERTKRAAMGLQVFERNSCTKCHTTATQTTALAPSLKGIAGQKIDYLIESVLYPSKIIKTGFESETVVTTGGKVLTGLVKDEGKFLRVLNLDREDKIAKTDVESRSVSRVSIMPEGQEATMSRREFVDLIAYLATLK